MRQASSRRPFRLSDAGLLWCLLVTLAPSAWGSKQAHVPDWVRQAAAVPMPRLRPHDAAAILLDQTETTVDAQGHAVIHHREVIKLLTVAGHDYANYPLEYDQAGRVNALHSWTIGADEHEYQVDDKDMIDLSAVPNFEVFASQRVRVAHALAAEPGAIVAFESEIQEAPYITSWAFEVDHKLPSAGQLITLTLPPGWAYQDGWSHVEAVKPEQVSASAWRWQIGPRASLDDEPAAPQLGEVAGRMMLSYAGGAVASADHSWSTVGDWFSRLAQGRDASSPEIASKVAELTAGKSGFMDKMLAITGFAQDEIRYVAVEMGIGGWQPHPAHDVFRNRYGDCKDKATLVVAMLADAGITAHTVMVDFDHRIDPAMPSHYADHMITAIEIPAGLEDTRLQAVVEASGKRLLIFDPTNQVSPAGSLEPELQGSYGLMMAGSNSLLLHLPVLTPRENVLFRTGTFTLLKDGSLSGEMHERREGNTADILRHLYLQGDARKLQEREEQSVGFSLSNFTLSGLTAVHATERSLPLEVGFHVLANSYAKHAGAMLLVRPSVVGMYRPRAMEAKARFYPVAMGQEEEEREEYTITLPAGYQADDLPDPVKIETHFATFQNAVTIEGSTLHYTRELVIRAIEIPASEYEQYREFVGQVGNAERMEAVLKPTP